MDKASGKSEKITIKNDKGRLSKEEIERMVSEAEKFKTDDEAVASRIKAKNDLENYCYNVKNSLSQDEVAGKLSTSDKSKIEKVTKEALEWLDNNREASKSEFEDKQKEVEGVVSPIMMKMYQGTGATTPDSGSRPAESSGPTVEEVD